ncbi:MAG TPA: ATP-binding protein [Lacunisphaera sp.]|nr:ATP-binding protein [Lacunisphaera sp.]
MLTDHLGRLFVGAEGGLRVFDGQSWHAFPVAETHSLKALAWGRDGRLWAGATNEVGFFTEDSLGQFRYHSLVEKLPPDARDLGVVWACGVVDEGVVFIAHTKVLRWDGSSFRVWSFPTDLRLCPMRLRQDLWFYHAESGLYRLAANGPRLEYPSDQLSSGGVIGLAEDDRGLLCVGKDGIFRPGSPPQLVSDPELNRYLTASRPSGMTTLPDGNLAIGTVSGGLAIVSQAWRLVRVFDTGDGLPSRTIAWVAPDATSSQLWVLTSDGIARLESTGAATLVQEATGIGAVTAGGICHDGIKNFVLTRQAVSELHPISGKAVQLSPLAGLTSAYNDITPFRGGLLLSRFGGMDFYAEGKVREIYAQAARSVFFAQRSRDDPARLFVSEQPGLGELVAHPDGSFEHKSLANLPDILSSVYEGRDGGLWLGTFASGAFVYDLKQGSLRALNDPASGSPLKGATSVFGDEGTVVLLNHGRAFLREGGGSEFRPLAALPNMGEQWVVAQIPGRVAWLVAFMHQGTAHSQALGVLSLNHGQTPSWQELDPPDLAKVGIISALDYTLENDHPVLWVGGSESLIRYDFDAIPAMARPDAPLIRLDTGRSTRATNIGEPEFAFKDHRIAFQIFTASYFRGRDLLFETRLGDNAADWTAPSERRTYEFSNLSEGGYHLEVRAVNRAGLVSEPAAFSFRILPPWYRDGWAYAGYVAAIGAMVFGFVRIRERRIRERNQELERQVRIRTEELVKANAAKDEFLASVSHEIRNPMNGVIGIAETLRTDALDADSRRKFGLLRQCATHLGSLLEDLLDFSRVQAGAVELEEREFVLSELVQSVAAMTSAESERRGIPLDVAISPAVPDRLKGDPRRIRQILLNFVGNALKFSGRGQVRLTVWCKPGGHLRTDVIFAVSDDGPGIPPDEQKRLFTRFERGSAAQRGRVPGTGLGLALCKGLAEKMGGRLWLESEPGEGSCFYFSAPFEHAAETAEPAVRPPIAPVQRAGVALVVDDEEYNRVVLIDLLESLGYRVVAAADGGTAVTLATEQEIDVAFLDYDLPGLSGLDVARTIRGLTNRSARARILATTAFTTADKRTQCLAAGMNGFLNKPVTLERLRQALAVATEAAAAVPTAAAPPVDPLANMRLIARRKSVPLAEEVSLYLSEFSVEFEQLLAALQEENAAAAGHYAHLLYGRCAFIAERQLEEDFRQIEALGAAAEWDAARALGREVQARFDALSLRLASADPIGPTG